MRNCLLFIGLFLSYHLSAQTLIVQDSISGKIKKLQPGKIIGLITATDTLYGEHYTDSAGRYYSPKNGVHELRVSPVNPDRITLLNRLNHSEKTYKLHEIRFVTFPKERCSAYRYGLALLGAGGTILGIVGLIQDMIQQKPLGPSLVSISIGISAFSWLHLTRKWTDDRNHRILRID